MTNTTSAVELPASPDRCEVIDELIQGLLDDFAAAAIPNEKVMLAESIRGLLDARDLFPSRHF